MPNRLMELTPRQRQFHPPASAADQLNAEVPLQLLQLPAELALPIRVVPSRGHDAAYGDDFGERP